MLKDMGVIKHYFKNVKKITKISIENALHDLLVRKKGIELYVTRHEQLQQQVMLNEVIKDKQRLATLLFFICQ